MAEIPWVISVFVFGCIMLALDAKTFKSDK